MKKIGFYGSSFDPITNVHLWTANTISDRFGLDKVIFGPCSNKRTDKIMQTEDVHRWNMLQLAIAGEEKFIADDYEMKRNAWEISTRDTMRHYRNKYKDAEVFFIMGADLLVDIAEGKWDHTEELIAENRFIIMARNNINVANVIATSPILRNYESLDKPKFINIDKGFQMEISSTYIRQEFERGGDPKYLMPAECYDYIKEHQLYMGGK
ncbi:nicotinate (nicotinamide) nucleotide adenylyltransferase [Bacillus sp. Brlt_9]|uniref:nicotinate (nicotinamide) nucleotide adenylyltransferase n=1 Tax=Bacillus sp. Brlt_9 TaxID=3110916 RepID=UPI003F7CCA4A